MDELDGEIQGMEAINNINKTHKFKHYYDATYICENCKIEIQKDDGSIWYYLNALSTIENMDLINLACDEIQIKKMLE